MEKLLKSLLLVLFTLTLSMGMTACGDDDDDEPKKDSLVGKWVLTEDNLSTTYDITITFNSNKTGTIIERMNSSARAEVTLSMDFSWSTTSDSNGNDILKVSYVSGDRNTIFPNSSSGGNTVLWSRQYVQTGKILNIYDGGGVWVFNKK